MNEIGAWVLVNQLDLTTEPYLYCDWVYSKSKGVCRGYHSYFSLNPVANRWICWEEGRAHRRGTVDDITHVILPIPMPNPPTS